MANEYHEWVSTRTEVENEVDVTDISEVHSDLTNSAQKLMDLLIEDIAGLEEIIGDELTFDDLDSAMRQSPSVIIAIIRRIIEFIQALTSDIDNIEIMTLGGIILILRKSLSAIKMMLAEANDGEVPGWLDDVENIFEFAAKYIKMLNFNFVKDVILAFTTGKSEEKDDWHKIWGPGDFDAEKFYADTANMNLIF